MHTRFYQRQLNRLIMNGLVLHKSADRGHANHGWLDTFHSFSFARWYNPQHLGIGPLRVLNQDRIAGGRGFGAHRHNNMEIISIVLEGALEHKDSSGTHSIIKPGEIQIMSAGTGVSHSEMNHLKDGITEFLQIWIEPKEQNTPMSYQQKQINQKLENSLPILVSQKPSENDLSIQQDVSILGGEFSNISSAKYTIDGGRCGYLHLAKGDASINGIDFSSGDGAYIPSGGEIFFKSKSEEGYFLLFDLPKLN